MRTCLLLSLLLIQNPLALVGASFYIGPDGSDVAGDGSLQNPWRTLEKARDHLRTFTTQTEDLEVLLLPGIYYRNNMFQLSSADSGRSGFKRIYRAAEGPGSVVISGGVTVTETWTDAGGGLWQVTLDSGLEINTLFVDDVRYHLARYPNRNTGMLRDLYPLSFAPYLTSAGGGVSGGTSFVTTREGEVDASLFTEDCYINIWPRNDFNWNFWSLEVTQYTDLTAGGQIDFDNLGDTTDPGEDARFFLSGGLAMLDAQDEFHYNNLTGVLTVFLEAGQDPNNMEVVVPILDALVLAEGNPFALATVSRVRLDGLIFEYTAFSLPSLTWWSTGYGTTDTGLITLRHTELFEILNCTIRFAGRHGILMTGGTRFNVVEDSLVSHAGISGIALSNRISNSSFVIQDNTIRNVCVYSVGEMGIDAAGITLFNASSNLVQNVLISDSNRFGISVRGNGVVGGGISSFPPADNNLIEYALIRNTNQDSGDSGGFHMAGVNGLTTNYINTLRQSIIEDTRSVPGQNDPQPPRGIFLDWDFASEDQVFENVELINAEGLLYDANDNPTQTFSNVSWQPGFDESLMQRDLIGLTAGFPYECPVDVSARNWDHDLVLDQSNPLYSEFGGGWNDSTVGRQSAADEGPQALVKSRLNSTADGASRAEWDIPINSDGYYRVLVYKYELASDNALSTPFTLDHQDLSLSQSFLFGTDGPRWQEWQSAYFSSAAPTTVSIFSHTGGARADAVRFILADYEARMSNELLLDNIGGIRGSTTDGFGYRFSLAEAAQVNSLGVWRGSVASGPVEVELREYPGGTILASAAINDSPGDSFYLYEPLAQAVELTTATSYELIAFPASSGQVPIGGGPFALADYHFTNSGEYFSSDTESNTVASDLTVGPGAPAPAFSALGNPARSLYWSTGWFDATATLANNRYLSVTVTPETGVEIDYTSFVFELAVQDTQLDAPRQYGLFSSADGFTSVLATGFLTKDPTNDVFNSYSISLAGSEFQGVTTATEFRLVLFDRPEVGTAREFRIDNVTVNGNLAVASPASPRDFIHGLAPDGGDMINSVRAHSFEPIFNVGGISSIYPARSGDLANRVEVLLGPNMRFARTFESWAGAYGLAANPTSDADQDGLELLLEYALDKNPNLPDIPGNRPALGTAGPQTFTFPRFTDRTDIDYVVQFSSNLNGWTDAAQSLSGGDTLPLSGDFSIGTNGTDPVETTVTHHNPPNPVFWRLSIR